MFSERDHFWMQHAIQLAKTAATEQEVPVGAVLVLNDQLVAEGWNKSIQDSDPSSHAEIIALRAAGIAQQNYRLIDSTLYVTLEPCVMCVGALVHARVKRVVFGAYDPKSGAVQSAFQLAMSAQFNHQPMYQGGLLSECCGKLLSDFFQQRRSSRIANRNQLDNTPIV